MSGADRARSLISQIEAARTQGGRIRLAVTLIVLLMFGFFGMSIRSKIKAFDDQALVLHLQEQAAKTIWPRVSRELDAIAVQAHPAIVSAFEAEAAALLPKLSDKLSAEALVLQANLNKQIKTSLDGALAAAMKENEAALKEAMPDLANDSVLYDDLVRRLQVSASQWAQEQLDTIFHDHVHVLQSINTSVATLQEQVAAEEAAGNRQPADVDQALMLFVEIINARLNEGG